MELDDVRALLLKRAKRFAGKRFGSAGLSKWADHHGAKKSHVSEFLHGKRLPTTAILDGLGLEWRIVRKARAHAKDESDV